MSNMKNSPPVVFYGYEASPASAKIVNVLSLKGIPHHKVEVPMTLPRPEIIDALGIGYRRVPVVAIGNDVYCDSTLIASALEHHFPPNQGFPTLFPSRKDGGKTDIGMIEALAAFYVDRPLFYLASTALPYNKFAPEFVEDRNKVLSYYSYNEIEAQELLKQFGVTMDVEKVTARQPIVRSLLSSHMALLEKQLEDGREWLFDTVTVGYGDLALYSVFGWIIRFRGMREVLTKEKFPRSTSWIGKMGNLVKSVREANAHAVHEIDGAAAAKIIAESSRTQNSNVGFDRDEATLLGLKQGEKVQVVPDDNAKNYPTIGNLIGLSREEVVLQLKGSAVPSLYCHFPRLNYSVSPVAGATSKL